MPFTNQALDILVSKHLSELTQSNAPEVSTRFPQSIYWIKNFSLNLFAGGSVTDDGKVFIFFFLRRAEAAFIEYEYARRALITFVNSLPLKNIDLYFKALHHFETVIAMLWQAYDMYRDISGHDYFDPKDKNDDSNYRRLNYIYNTSRHFSPSQLPAGDLHAVWLTNSGFHVPEITNNGGTKIPEKSLTYAEIEGFLVEIRTMSNTFSKANS